MRAPSLGRILPIVGGAGSAPRIGAWGQSPHSIIGPRRRCVASSERYGSLTVSELPGAAGSDGPVGCHWAPSGFALAKRRPFFWPPSCRLGPSAFSDGGSGVSGRGHGRVQHAWGGLKEKPLQGFSPDGCVFASAKWPADAGQASQGGLASPPEGLAATSMAAICFANRPMG